MDIEDPEDWKGWKMEFAAEENINAVRKQVDAFLLLLAPYMGWKPEHMEHVWVSDMSSLGDFRLDDADLELLSTQIGFKLSSSDKIYEIAARMIPTKSLN